MLTTIPRYRRPLLARAVWAFVGVLHRRTARQVVAGAPPAPPPPSSTATHASATDVDRSREGVTT